MMKRMVVILLAIMMFTGCASMNPPIVTDTSSVKIVETGKTKDEAFDLSMRWMAQAFKSSKDVIQYSDKSAGTINGKGICTVEGNLGSTIDISFALILDLKDTRTRLSFKALTWSVPSLKSTGEDTQFNQFIFDKFKVRVDEITKSYLDFINSDSTNW
jgi:hypothetical protein